jgi:uncharacterized lipoprotein YajG
MEGPMLRVLVATLLLSGCTPTQVHLSEFPGTPQTRSQEAAHHECYAFSRSDIKKDFQHQYVACMAKYGWKVEYK